MIQRPNKSTLVSDKSLQIEDSLVLELQSTEQQGNALSKYRIMCITFNQSTERSKMLLISKLYLDFIANDLQRIINKWLVKNVLMHWSKSGVTMISIVNYSNMLMAYLSDLEYMSFKDYSGWVIQYFNMELCTAQGNNSDT